MKTERDSMGEMSVPDDALYGALMQRAVLNFPQREARGAGLRQVVCACCALAVELTAPEPDEAAVHRARQALKRVRAVLRLGETMGIAGAKAARRRLSRHARELSPMRDATVATKVAQRLARRLDGALQASAMVRNQPHAMRRGGGRGNKNSSRKRDDSATSRGLNAHRTISRTRCENP